jgi:hypothetical protein
MPKTSSSKPANSRLRQSTVQRILLLIATLLASAPPMMAQITNEEIVNGTSEFSFFINLLKAKNDETVEFWERRVPHASENGERAKQAIIAKLTKLIEKKEARTYSYDESQIIYDCKEGDATITATQFYNKDSKVLYEMVSRQDLALRPIDASMQSIACLSYNSRSIGAQFQRASQDRCKEFWKTQVATASPRIDPLRRLKRLGILLRMINREQVVNILPSYNRLKYNLRLIGIEVIDLDSTPSSNIDFILEMTLSDHSTPETTATKCEASVLVRAEGKRQFCPALKWEYDSSTGSGLPLVNSYQVNLGNFFSNFLIDYAKKNPEKRFWTYDVVQEKLYVSGLPF